MKRREIRTLYHQYPELLNRALAIEDRARPNLTTVKGLGRNWAWRDFLEHDEGQLALSQVFPEDNLPAPAGGASHEPRHLSQGCRVHPYQ